MNQKINTNSQNFKPREDSVLVQYVELEQEEKTASGLVISTQRSSLERPTQGTVIAVGDEVKWIKAGETVVWAMTDGINLDFNNEKCLLLRDKSILGIVK